MKMETLMRDPASDRNWGRSFRIWRAAMRRGDDGVQPVAEHVGKADGTARG
jgi:hypothetical protein